MANNQEVGKPLNRVDGRLKVAGAATYAAEWKIPDLTHGALIQAGIGAGRIVELDLTEALAQTGVIRIFTYEDTGDQTVTNGFTPDMFSQQLFGGPEILYNGQYIGLVVADTPERARHAAELVRIRYRAESPRVDITEHAGEEVQIEAAPDVVSVNRGDVAEGSRQATQRVSTTYEVAPEHHNPMEPPSTIVQWEGDRLTVYEATQMVDGTRDVLADMFDLPVENVRVICPFLGGGFGCKGPWLHVPITATAARMVGRPVKLVMRRQEMFNGLGHRPHTIQELELGATDDGTLCLIDHRSTNETSLNDDWREDTGTINGILYACPNVRSSISAIRVNKMVPTWMRAPNEAIGSVALECAMDELAEKLGMDPVEFRLKNDTTLNEAEKKPFSSRSLRECLQAGADAIGWKDRPFQPRTLREGNFLVGYGVASAMYPANSFPSTATLTLSANGQLVVRSSSHDIGTGAYTIFSQLGSDTVGVPLEQVRVELGDTNLPPGTIAAGSTTTASTGTAIMNAGSELGRSLITSLLTVDSSENPLRGANAEEVEIENGQLYRKSQPDRRISFLDALKMTGQTEMTAEGSNGERSEEYSYWSFGANFVKVRVDESLGQIRVAKVVGAYGGGKIFNPKTARSQMIGNIMWGIGMGLHEHTEYDPNNGRVVTRNLADYHIPSCADTPEIEIIFIPEEDTQVSPTGAKGIGELGTVGMAAAISNAVYNATGKRFRQFPITPDKLVMA